MAKKKCGRLLCSIEEHKSRPTVPYLRVGSFFIDAFFGMSPLNNVGFRCARDVTP